MMTWQRRAVAVLDDLAVTGVTQRALRVVILLAAATAWESGVLAGATDSPVGFTVLLVAATWCAIVPDSHVGVLVPAALGWQWLAQLDRTTSGWVLLAASCLLAFHAATALCVYAPAAAAVHWDVVRPVVARTAAIAVVTAVAWTAVRWSPLTGRPGHLGLTFAALLGLALVATAAGRVLRPERAVR